MCHVSLDWLSSATQKQTSPQRSRQCTLRIGDTWFLDLNDRSRGKAVISVAIVEGARVRRLSFTAQEVRRPGQALLRLI